MDTHSRLDVLRDRVVFSQVRDALHRLAEDRKLLGDTAALQADSGKSETHIARFSCNAACLAEAIERAIAVSTDAKNAWTLQSLHSEVVKLAEQVTSSASAVCSLPGDQYTTEHHQAVLKSWDTKIAQVETMLCHDDTVFEAGDMLAANRMAEGGGLLMAARDTFLNDSDTHRRDGCAPGLPRHGPGTHEKSTIGDYEFGGSHW